MASTTLYDRQVLSELVQAWDKSKADSPVREHISAACIAVEAQQPMCEVYGHLIDAFRSTTKLSVLFALMQAVAFIGPMDDRAGDRLVTA